MPIHIRKYDDTNVFPHCGHEEQDFYVRQIIDIFFSFLFVLGLLVLADKPWNTCNYYMWPRPQSQFDIQDIFFTYEAEFLLVLAVLENSVFPMG